MDGLGLCPEGHIRRNLYPEEHLPREAEGMRDFGSKRHVRRNLYHEGHVPLDPRRADPPGADQGVSGSPRREAPSLLCPGPARGGLRGGGICKAPMDPQRADPPGADRGVSGSPSFNNGWTRGHPVFRTKFHRLKKKKGDCWWEGEEVPRL